jgi:CxxC motif-containing protein
VTPITHYLCIGCPLGCRLEVEDDEAGTIVEVRGHSCRKGKTFAEREHHDPRRMVTTTVSVNGGRWARLPVHTTTDVPKEMVADVVRQLRSVEVAAPVERGQLIATDVLGTGADVISSRPLPEA